MSLPRILDDAEIVSATPESLRADADYAEQQARHKRDEGNHCEGAELELRARRLRALADEMEGDG